MNDDSTSDAYYDMRFNRDSRTFVAAIDSALMDLTELEHSRFGDFIAAAYEHGVKARVLERDEQSVLLEMTKGPFEDGMNSRPIQIRLLWKGQ